MTRTAENTIITKIEKENTGIRVRSTKRTRNRNVTSSR